MHHFLLALPGPLQGGCSGNGGLGPLRVQASGPPSVWRLPLLSLPTVTTLAPIAGPAQRALPPQTHPGGHIDVCGHRMVTTSSHERTDQVHTIQDHSSIKREMAKSIFNDKGKLYVICEVSGSQT